MKKDSIFCHSFIYKNAYRKDDNGYYQISSYGMHEVEKRIIFCPVLTRVTYMGCVLYWMFYGTGYQYHN